VAGLLAAPAAAPGPPRGGRQLAGPTNVRATVITGQTRQLDPARQPELLAERQECALVLEQEALDVKPAAEARERARRADHAMARQDDRKRVPAVRGADGPG